MDIASQKKEIREILLKKREAISAERYQQQSARIIKKLKALEHFQNAEAIHCYVSMNSRREVDTHMLIKDMIGSSKKVIIPEANFADHSMSHHQLDSFSDLSPNKWNVLETVKENPFPLSNIDLVVVPMVGGDERGNRIGYGKGFYDRFLQQVKALKVGLIFEQNIVEELPAGKFDVKMDYIITEERVLKFSQC